MHSSHIQQHNCVANANSRILNVILTTEDLKVSIDNNEFPLVPEDAHHASLKMVMGMSSSENFPMMDNAGAPKSNFHRANLVQLYSLS